jgi:hypothetical protein
MMPGRVISGRANGSIYYGFSGVRRRSVDANKPRRLLCGHRLVDLFPARKADFDAKMAQLTFDPADASTDLTTQESAMSSRTP